MSEREAELFSLIDRALALDALSPAARALEERDIGQRLAALLKFSQVEPQRSTIAPAAPANPT